MYKRDKEYIQDFIDPGILGQLIGEGFRSRVYSLRRPIRLDEIQGVIHNVNEQESLAEESPFLESMVVKIPRSEFRFASRLFPPLDPQTKLQIMRMGQEYFYPFVVRPTFMIEQDGKYWLLQRRLRNFENINPYNIGQVQDQVQEVVKSFSRLIRDGLYLDMLGSQGVLACLKALYSPDVTAVMTNMLIEGDQERHICMPDITLIPIGRASRNPDLFPKIRRVISPLGYWISLGLIRHHFGIDLRGR